MHDINKFAIDWTRSLVFPNPNYPDFLQNREKRIKFVEGYFPNGFTHALGKVQELPDDKNGKLGPLCFSIWTVSELAFKTPHQMMIMQYQCLMT